MNLSGFSADSMQNVFSDPEIISFDSHLAGFLCRHSLSESPILFLTIAFMSSKLRDGHICIDLGEFELTSCPKISDTDSNTNFPSLDKWKEVLLESGITGIPGEYKPLILDNNRLYFYRRWNNERAVAEFLLSRISTDFPPGIFSCIDTLNSFFQKTQGEIDFQKLSSVLSLANRLCVISGGPGTGKTTTVVKILALHCIVYGTHLRIGLAAPTGKAAARLSFSISQAIESLPCDSSIKKAIPSDTVTIHRMLGEQKRNRHWGSSFTGSDYLPYDIIVIDEASMIDLSLMSKLTAYMRPECRLILLGDKDQLSSVEAGSVLGDICDPRTLHSYTPEFIHGLQKFIPEIKSGDRPEVPFANCIVTLKKSYRFDSMSMIGQLSLAINNGDSSKAFEILDDSSQNECIFRPFTSEMDFSEMLIAAAREHYRPLLKLTDPLLLFSCFDSFRILCAVRDGAFGVESVNNRIISLMTSHQSIDNNIYHGKPVLITRNDYRLKVFNGDTGIFIKDKDDFSSKIAFRNQDGSIIFKHPFQIRNYENAYAMTIHKSQGSEFDTVLIILPQMQLPLLTRELLYTAVTRAKKRVVICGPRETLDACIRAKIRRSSGLRERLWDGVFYK